MYKINKLIWIENKDEDTNKEYPIVAESILDKIFIRERNNTFMFYIKRGIGFVCGDIYDSIEDAQKDAEEYYIKQVKTGLTKVLESEKEIK